MPIESNRPSSGLNLQNIPSNEGEKTSASSGGIYHGKNVVLTAKGKAIIGNDSYTDTFLDSFSHVRTITQVHKKNSKLPSIRSSGTKQLNVISNQLKMYWYDGHATVELHENGGRKESLGFYPSGIMAATMGGKGAIEQESYLDEAVKGGWPTLSIDLTEEQARNVEREVKDYKSKCKEGDEECLYSPIKHNCAGFAQDVYQWAGQQGHWLSQFTDEQLAKNSGIQNTYMLLAGKPYGEADSIGARLQIWGQERLNGIQENPANELSANIALFGVAAAVTSTAYKGAKCAISYAGQKIKNLYRSEPPLPPLEVSKVKEFIVEGVKGLEKIRKSVDYILNHSGDGTVDKDFRRQVTSMSVDLCDELDKLNDIYQKLLESKTVDPANDQCKFRAIAEKLNRLSSGYIELCQKISRSDVIGANIEGDIQTVRKNIQTILKVCA